MNLNNLGTGKKLINQIIAQGKTKNRIGQQVKMQKNSFNPSTRPTK